MQPEERRDDRALMAAPRRNRRRQATDLPKCAWVQDYTFPCKNISLVWTGDDFAPPNVTLCLELQLLLQPGHETWWNHG
jgi:hypothetical protein